MNGAATHLGFSCIGCVEARPENVWIFFPLLVIGRLNEIGGMGPGLPFMQFAICLIGAKVQ